MMTPLVLTKRRFIERYVIMTHNSSINANMKNMKGLTLIELLVTLAVVAIVVAFGLPSLQKTSQSSRLTSAINTLSGDMAFARSEAVTRNKSIRIRTVNGGGDWSGGWVVETVDTATALRNAPALPANIVLNGLAGADSITFRSDGTQTGASASFLTCKSGESGSYGRQIDINASGRIQLFDKKNCP
jgi:type IV fimbrial biogenesis protein FimT